MAKGKELATTVKAWDYATAVTTGKNLVTLYNRVTLDLVREIYAAREALAKSGTRTDLTSRQDVARLSPWEQYCEDIGLSLRTAQRWLKFYLPEENRLLTSEELKAIQIEEFEALIKQLKPTFPEWRPDGWTAACEQYYREKMKGQKLLDISKRKRFEQLDLFDAAYYETLTSRITFASADDVVHFAEIQKKIEPVAYPGIPVNKQAHAFLVVEKMLQDFPEGERKHVAKALADMTRLYAEEAI
ncbi:hypothetical protein [Parasphaerochaeta coccoides]|uniref:Uncharacterized protein n=1 Tax=Parasphaerochaeta coccoides (strain ATCC BAA-1237 / DSM 17374 / SPN1) TaxID=760011 RepID=F4GHU0_PARC1|nr:hypothetical protein [Parasphaerochaeta coccoides]AEC02053.1 hypothetical protein Spico_0829 [Parasphaerochaeta coccoides DSM 17374]